MMMDDSSHRLTQTLCWLTGQSRVMMSVLYHLYLLCPAVQDTRY